MRYRLHLLTGGATAAVLAALTLTLSSGGSTCHARSGGQLPDRSCTPGVIDPRVTQKNISTTICKSGYTATVRPSESVTNRIKRQQISAYGYSNTAMSDYEEDHLISLELGGSPADPRNLWPEHPPSPNPKDEVENRLHREVCGGQITLAQAQHEIATDWRTAQ
jgi:hypothetical protein